MDPKGRLTVFLSEFDYQVHEIERILSILQQRMAGLQKGAATAEAVESTGYWLHNLYCAFEDLFKRVAGFWENQLAENGEYHIHLIKRMLIAIEGVRPALISEKSYTILDELRGFRHVFRHAYSYGLDDERVSFLLRRVLEKKDVLTSDLKAFRDSVAELDL
jgi:hypothetical protein